MPWTEEVLARRLGAREPREPFVFLGRRAAVAAIVRFAPGPSVLLMRRAEHPGDRWSGHVSLPGGRAEEGEDLLAAAIRETREEVGLDLGAARVLGRLPPVRALARGKLLPMVVAPFVFAAPEAAVVLGPEASRAFWFPLDKAARGELDARHPYRIFGKLPWRFPCWRHEGETVWGLTYMILQSLLRA